MFRECGNHAAADAHRKSGRLKRLFCQLGLWLVDRCCAPAPPISVVRETAPKLSERASRRILHRISATLCKHGPVEKPFNSKRA
jgi:hypothetical protein